jgi:hypothetical protein
LTVLQHISLIHQLFRTFGKFHLLAKVVPLCINSAKDSILAMMPSCNAQGVKGDWQEPSATDVKAWLDNLVEEPTSDEDIFTKYDDSTCLSWKEILSLVDKYHKVNSFLVEHVTLIRKNFILPKSWTFRITRIELMASRVHGQEAMRKE